MTSEPKVSVSGPAAHYERLLDADEALRGGKYAKAARLYSGLAAADPANGRLWLYLASAHRKAGNTEGALAAYLQVADTGFSSLQDFLAPIGEVTPVSEIEFGWDEGDGTPPQAKLDLHIARLYAQLGKPEEALDWLERALRDRLPGRTRLADDPGFKALRRRPRFKRIAGIPRTRAKTRPARWRADIDFIVGEAQRLHASPWERQAFGRRFLGYAKRLKDDAARKSDEEMELGLRRLVALLGDGHSWLMPPGGFGAGGVFVQADLKRFSDGIFVLGGEGEIADHAGAEVMKIGSRTAEVLFREAKSYFGQDNAMQHHWSFGDLLEWPVFLHVHGALADRRADSVEFTVRTGSGATAKVGVPIGPTSSSSKKLVGSPISSNPVPLWLQQPERYYWVARAPELRGVWFQFNELMIDHEAGTTPEQIAAELQRLARSTRAENLVVDVRRNNGGSIEVGAPFLRAIAAFQDADPARRVFVICGRGSFSATPIWLGLLENVLPDVVFVGEPTSGRPSVTASEGPTSALPYSGFLLNVSCTWHCSNPIVNDQRPFIPISMPVELSSKDYFSNRDPAYEAIAQVVRAR
jgi:tetratricopeptide (TPR) repeat protein